MAHQIQDLVGESGLHSGNDIEITVTVTDDGTSSGTAINLNGATEISWKVFTWSVESILIFEKKLSDSEIEITDGPNGEMTITVAASDTSALFGHYKHRCDVTDQDGNVTTIFSGTLEVFSPHL